jgi:hypothetical protein
MKKANEEPSPDEMRDEYDFRGGARGKYYERYRQGTNLVLLDPDLARVFHDSEMVNVACGSFSRNTASLQFPPRTARADLVAPEPMVQYRACPVLDSSSASSSWESSSL